MVKPTADEAAPGEGIAVGLLHLDSPEPPLPLNMHGRYARAEV